ncbi:MAG: ABC transporter ATP-binding protein [Novosphingobium sp.]|nr:ABC transporter ATP-binding protein [Novosphingobium sp.]
MSELAIDVTGLRKTFGSKVAVENLDLQLPRGEVWGFVGPNGSGKTTTIRMICGLLKPTEGEGQCLGFDFRTEAGKIKREVGYMTQKFSFWTDLTIRENLEFVARLYLMDDIAGTVDRTLDGLGLTDRQHQLAGALSGGWQQRLALAAVTMHQPQLLLLDEPTAGVDPQARRDFWDQIRQISGKGGVTVLVSTHYMDEAERCDQIAYLANGRLVVKGSVHDIIAQSNLVTFRAEGDDLRSLSAWLEHRPGVEHITHFGAALLVSGTDRALIEKTIGEGEAAGFRWQEVRPSLEDAFIALAGQAGRDQRWQA